MVVSPVESLEYRLESGSAVRGTPLMRYASLDGEPIMFVSWKHQHTDFPQPPSFDDKVVIFYERIWGWQLHIAELCLDGGKDHGGKTDVQKIPHSAFAAMQIMLSYFEMIAKYEDGFIPTGGNHQAGKYFKRGVRSVFPSLATENAASVDELLAAIWKKARCGLYHMSQTAAGIVLTGDIAEAIQFNTTNKVLIINPHRLPAVLKGHLEDYRGRLLDPTNVDLRRDFEQRYDHDNPTPTP